MTRASFDAWEAQRPSEGFADRMAASVLKDRVLAPHSRSWVGRGVARPGLLLAAAACVLVAGAAWGWNALPRTAAPVDAQPPDIRIERSDPAPGAAQGRSLPPSVDVVSARPPPLRTKPVALIALASSTHPPVVVVPAAVPSVPTPPCNCNAFACECGPEELLPPPPAPPPLPPRFEPLEP